LKLLVFGREESHNAKIWAILPSIFVAKWL